MDKPYLNFNGQEKSKIKGNIITITYGILLVALVLNIKYLSGIWGKFLGICSPFIIGFIIAYLLNRPYELIYNKALKFMDKSAPKAKKPVAVVLTYFLLFLVIGSFLGIVIPQIVSSGYNLVNNMSVYFKDFEKYVNEFTANIGLTGNFWEELNQIWLQISKSLAGIIENAIPALINFLTSLTSWVANAAIGFIVSIYFLVGKNKLTVQIKKILYAFFPKSFAEGSVRIARLTHKTFGNFIMGQLTVAMILGILCFISMSVLNMPYAMLISVIIGFTNIIPYFGPFLGAIPGVFILLTIEPVKAGIFVIVIVVLQQIDNSLISPRVVGGSLGLSGLWVLFAITVGGGLFGIPGMVIGAPTFAVVYTLIREAVYKCLEKKNITEI